MDELLEIGKDFKIKYNVSSPHYKLWGNFFIKKICMGEQTSFGKFLGGCFTWGLLTRSCKGEVNG